MQIPVLQLKIQTPNFLCKFVGLIKNTPYLLDVITTFHVTAIRPNKSFELSCFERGPKLESVCDLGGG